MFAVARSIVRQVGVATASAPQLEAGNLDPIVPVTFRDSGIVLLDAVDEALPDVRAVAVRLSHVLSKLLSDA